MLKHGFVEGTRRSHHVGAGRYSGEFVFAPRAADAAEDDGWLIGLVIDGGETSTTLEIIDAQAIRHRVPPGIHGAWLPA